MDAWVQGAAVVTYMTLTIHATSRVGHAQVNRSRYHQDDGSDKWVAMMGYAITGVCICTTYAPATYYP